MRNAVRHGANSNVQNDAGWTPLIYMTSLGREDAVKDLIEKHDADVNVVENDGWSALMFACFYGYEGIVQVLMSAGASQTFESLHGQTALSIATAQRHANVVRLLTHYRPLIGLRARFS